MTSWFARKQHDLQPAMDKLVRLASEHWPEDKWAFLYYYSRKSLDEEIDRFQRVDDKSIKLLSSVSVIITIFVALFKWVVEDSKVSFSPYVYCVAISLFSALGIAWFFFFKALKLQLTPRMPLDDSIFMLVKEKNMATIHVALYKSCQNAVNKSRDIVEGKAKKLQYGYKATSFSAVFLIIFVAMVSFESITYSYGHIKTKESTVMPDDNPKNPVPEPSSNEPDLDVTAPDIQMVTNSDDTPLETKGAIITESDD
ncbi:hypothetical protein L6J37_09090 [Photobacterium sp. WH77]|uniref:hypothetical protein n=1 Tax=unclassified Photobacterium TaxID=2628852 RepID=UPI001EDBAA6C|nr:MULTISPECIES: hypothetical protein [unclassified Photobacterium]MCG2836983.1 hypothetical protein [Photobacterium sp. WH77]MCG2844408.1 hypothetical protein [Photobacterium sp. WH80]